MTHLGTQLGRVLERQRAEERLANSEAQLRELAARLVSVREEERKHMARELHDELGQSLTALKIDLRTLQRRLPNPRTCRRGSTRCSLWSTGRSRPRSASPPSCGRAFSTTWGSSGDPMAGGRVRPAHRRSGHAAHRRRARAVG